VAWNDSDEGFQSFLDRAANHPLLTAQEERDLARRILDGDKQARERLIECNIRLVLAMVQKFRGRGLPLPDLVQEGIIGLHTAADKFDATKGWRFSTYATWWVRKTIQQGLAGAGAETIRLPPGVRQRRGRARSLMRENPTWTIEQVAAKMEEPADLVLESLRAAEVVASMDQDSWNEDGSGSSLGERLGDPDADDPHVEVTDPVPAGLAEAVANLAEPEQTVIRLRFGLGGGRPQAVNDIAESMGKPPHYVQAAQRRGLNALRSVMPPEMADDL